MIGFVYMWINKINGKKYIGYHEGLETDNYIGSGVYFKRAVKKYGLENFERIILYREFESSLNLYIKEMEIINEFNAVFSSDFYNLTNYDPKRISQIKMKGERIITEETREKMSKAAIQRAIDYPWTDEQRLHCSLRQIGKKYSSETIEKFRKANLGEKNPTYGKQWFNNGIEAKLFTPGEEPNDWVKGAIFPSMRGENNPSKRKDVKEKISKALQSDNRKGLAIYNIIDPNGKIYTNVKRLKKFFKEINTTYAIAKHKNSGWIIEKIGVVGVINEDN